MTDEQWKTRFKQYLIDQGYREYTTSGKPSTVYDYVNRINQVCQKSDYENGISWEDLSHRIAAIRPIYDVGGVKVDLGARSNKAYINALKRFEEMLQQH